MTLRERLEYNSVLPSSRLDEMRVLFPEHCHMVLALLDAAKESADDMGRWNNPREMLANYDELTAAIKAMETP